MKLLWALFLSGCLLSCRGETQAPTTQKALLHSSAAANPPGCQPDTLAPSQEIAPWLSRSDIDTTWLSDAEIIRYNKALSPQTEPPVTRSLSQRALLDALSPKLGQKCAANDPYCQTLLSEVLRSTFGLVSEGVPAGSFSVDLTPVRSADIRVRVLELLRTSGAVFLTQQDRTLLYLGKDEQGAASFLGGAERCKGTSELSILQLSEAQLSTFHDVRVLGSHIPEDLLGVIKVRAPAEASPPQGKSCEMPDGTAIFYSPETPTPSQRLRLMIVSDKHPGPVQLAVISPDDKRQTLSFKTFGGPPFTYVAEIETPSVGTWRAALGDGEHMISCREIKVVKKASTKTSADIEDPFWVHSRGWSEETEILYSAFVESLFSYPIEQDLTWKDLHSLLRDPEKNLLFNHFGRDEEKKLFLQPDCADLPVALRVYFAWKMSLPYGVRQCDRGKEGRAPECEGGLVATNLSPRVEPEEETAEPVEVESNPKEKKPKDPTVFKDNIKAFSRFATMVMVAMNSGAGRTSPKDSETDYYPIPLTREALRPGAVFADPYGHILIIAQWVPQTFESYGILMGADAQPDGTVGRRRFWRGSFLFTAKTDDVGAGFKAYRPLFRSGKKLVATGNTKLTSSKEFVPYSKEQYAGSTDDFYDKMDALANPLPLNPRDRLKSLVDALEEAVSRRVLAVQNGEDFLQKDPQEISMPKGYSIFETSGPWEDFATPSRDMRLLISIDTVEDFAASIRRRPERFGLQAGPTLEDEITKLSQEMSDELIKRSFEYKRQDGSPWRLNLQDVLDRKKIFEVGYNPNDCPEYRWGASEGSEEFKTCTRRAPKAQQKLLAEYQSWFTTRTRPPRR